MARTSHWPSDDPSSSPGWISILLFFIPTFNFANKRSFNLSNSRALPLLPPNFWGGRSGRINLGSGESAWMAAKSSLSLCWILCTVSETGDHSWTFLASQRQTTLLCIWTTRPLAHVTGSWIVSSSSTANAIPSAPPLAAVWRGETQNVHAYSCRFTL